MTIAASVGIARVPALAFAVLVHVTTLVITSVGGAVAFALGQRQTRGRVAVTVAAGAGQTDEVVRTEGA